MAARNPDKTFVVAGGKDLAAFGDDKQAVSSANLHYPGYVTDRENKALMQNCRASCILRCLKVRHPAAGSSQPGSTGGGVQRILPAGTLRQYGALL